ncbi:MAG: GTP pyrophosphokinase family protein [Lachnospiraceae bacterium]|nr:GTP pyrophosphokinase family protein [Lachnospiraceae bacterium]
MQPLNENAERLARAMASRLPHKEVRKWVRENAAPYKEMMTYYQCAIMAVETKVRVMNEELSLKYDRNPIETIKSRLKTVESIAEKLNKRNLVPTIEVIEQNITDIAGVRIICSYEKDIYMIADSLLRQDDITLVEKKDYIQNPKPNGYRSLHLIIETPIFLYDRKKYMRVEVQLRTISMDCWASLEHKIKYKKDLPEDVAQELEVELYECAQLSKELDVKMEAIQRKADVFLDNGL